MKIQHAKPSNSNSKSQANKLLTDEEKAKQKAITSAEICTRSIPSAAHTIDALNYDSLDIDTLINNLNHDVDRVVEGDTRKLEAILMTQVQTLNVLFHRTLKQVGHSDFVQHMQIFSDIALKAQNQCIKTLAVLANMKSPQRTTFIKQQNNAINQQVVNGENPENKKVFANELLEVNDGQRLDRGAACTSISADPEMEAVEICGGENNRR